MPFPDRIQEHHQQDSSNSSEKVSRSSMKSHSEVVESSRDDDSTDTIEGNDESLAPPFAIASVQLQQ